MNWKTVAVMAAAVWAGNTLVMAQDSPRGAEPTLVPGPTAAGARGKELADNTISTSFSLGGSYTFDADLDDDAGSVAIYRAAADFALEFPANDKLSFTLGTSEEYSWYDFDASSTGVTQGIGKPASQVRKTRISVGSNIVMSDKWSLLLGLNAESSGETDADFGDTLTGGGFIAGVYEVNDKLSLTVGFAAQSAIEDDAVFLPLIGFDWAFEDKWRLGVRGPGAYLTYSPNEEWDLTLQASYEARDFRLSDDSPIPDGVFRDRRAVVGLQAQWTPRPWLSLRGEVGVIAWSELKFDDEDGDKLDKLEIDPTGYVGLSATVRF